MTLAWILFAFVGLFTARYMREVWEPKQLMGTKAWFTVGIISATKEEEKWLTLHVLWSGAFSSKKSKSLH